MNTTQTAAERIVRCRYLRRNNDRCTAEATHPDGEVQLCPKHLGRAWELIRAAVDTAKTDAAR